MGAQGIKNLGGLLQLLGVIWVVWDLVGQSRYLGHFVTIKAKVSAAWWRVLRRLGRRRAQKIVAVGIADEGTIFGSATVTVSRGLPVAPPDAGVEERLNAIEQWATKLQQWFGDARMELDAARRKDREAVRRDIEATKREIDTQVAELKGRLAELKDVTVGGASLRWGGVPVLLAGIACSTWPDGLAEHFLFWLPWWVLMMVLALVCAASLTWKIIEALTAADATRVPEAPG
jgi:hypothetical protein